jgi:hypothetical protein
MVWVLLALGATLISAIAYRNHIRFSACSVFIFLPVIIFFNLILTILFPFIVLRSTSPFIGKKGPLYYWQSNDGFTIVLTNLFTLATLLCGASVILVGVLIKQK